MTTSMATIHGNLQKQHTMSRIDDLSIKKDDDGRRLTNYVAFTSKMVVGVAIDSNNYSDSDDESTEDFVNSYNLMLEKWDQVCKINAKLIDEKEIHKLLKDLKEKDVRLKNQKN
ncbi:hypothetical protein V6N11_038699 [Hibiscus sabdariffa]|uniref:Uncharacterized protein n=1 Tax=Hibiscus sabdariffa TaxID=183260 RepID=A0ABR2SL11_9ROSI